MVIKLAPTALEDDASVCPHSMLMPGCVLGSRATLLDNSQVLKGEAVPTGERWAGLPAMNCPSTPLPLRLEQELTEVRSDSAALVDDDDNDEEEWLSFVFCFQYFSYHEYQYLYFQCLLNILYLIQ